MAAPMLPPDKKSEHRKMVDGWDALWHARYRYPNTATDTLGRTRVESADAAPGYTRSFSHLVAGLFERQTPEIVDGGTDPVVSDVGLSDLLQESVAKGAGYGSVVLRPVARDGAWVLSVVAPTRFQISWVHRTPAEIVMWDYATDPRYPDDNKRGLAVIETWTPGDELGSVTTTVWETRDGANGTELTKQVPTDNPPEALADHPFIVSASNDEYPRDVVPFVWAWEDCGPVPLWYTAEKVVAGLARLWDQEQDDAEMTRKRVAMPGDLLGTTEVRADGSSEVLARPGFNKNDNLLLLSSSMSAQHGPNGGVTPIEFSDDLVQRDRIERRENSLLEMVGINPASIGRNVGGRSDSAAAKRADNQMTMNTITAPARRIEQTLSVAVSSLGALNNRPGDVTVKVYEGLKENPAESAEVARMLRDAEAASTRTLVETAHPAWTDEQVNTEIAAMQSDGSAVAPIE